MSPLLLAAGIGFMFNSILFAVCSMKDGVRPLIAYWGAVAMLIGASVLIYFGLGG